MSEVILQQTKIKQGLPFYFKFIENYPSARVLSDDNIDNILRLWQGLGYYRRAINMHNCAKQIVDNYNGEFPKKYAQLLKLKGIGKYTASAIASICFNETIPTVDGNVFRFASRHFGIFKNISKSATYNFFVSYLQSIIPSDSPGDFNQAMMEFGATVCKPKAPHCQSCVFSTSCYAKKNNSISQLPVKSAQKSLKRRYLYYCFAIFDNKIWIKKRDKIDIWHGLYECILIEKKKNSIYDKVIMEQVAEIIGVSDCNIEWRNKMEIKHLLTHQSLNIHLICAYINTFPQKLELHDYIPIPIDEIKKYPFPIVLANYLKEI